MSTRQVSVATLTGIGAYLLIQDVLVGLRVLEDGMSSTAEGKC
jgi:hypothetical protein